MGYMYLRISYTASQCGDLVYEKEDVPCNKIDGNQRHHNPQVAYSEFYAPHAPPAQPLQRLGDKIYDVQNHSVHRRRMVEQGSQYLSLKQSQNRSGASAAGAVYVQHLTEHAAVYILGQDKTHGPQVEGKTQYRRNGQNTHEKIKNGIRILFI